MFRPFILAALCVLSTLWLGASLRAAELADEVVFDIPAQPLESALLKLSEQSGVQIQMASVDVPELQVAGVSGRMPLSKALAALLKQTGLSYRMVGETTVAIYRDHGAGSARKLRTGTLLASTAQAAPLASASAQGEPIATLEEVVVTAQKREEKMQDVPISITALSGEHIENRGVNGLADLNALAPNVMFRQSPGARLISVVSIRGSAMGQPAIWVDPPVGLYLNGIYLGKSQGSVFDIVDIERV
ncbi:MAG TPA: secretin and TonB N-terminal domain-containing protein, partial [Steroidobacter sp.]|nr:secretin and TonB N-terminal domain-containing protein [Steroidobacter sp.]